MADVQLWFARGGGVPVREQLATQLMLAIVSGELAPGQRLPSTRALAKRFRLHANTVSAAYRQLEDLGLVESVRGSGVYVRKEKSESKVQLDALDRLARAFIQAARSTGLPATAVRERLDRWLNKRPSRFVFVDPDENLRAIVCLELGPVLTWDVVGCPATADGVLEFERDSIFLTVPSQAAAVLALIPAGSELVALRVRQVARSLAEYLPVQREVLTVVASGWKGFLQIARTMLTAAGYDPEALVFRDTKVSGWQRGLGAGCVLVCDAMTAGGLPAGPAKIVFPLVSDAAITELKSYERFFQRAL